MKLSVIMPVYNEIHTIDSILAKAIAALPEVTKEIVVVDDGSSDGTREWLTRIIAQSTPHAYITLNSEQQLIAVNGAELVSTASVTVPISMPVAVKVILHPCNQGKGAALQTGFQAATGDVVVIQDADLEYDPHDWSRMWRLIEQGWADVVYGSRFYGEPHRVLYFHHFLGNKIITGFINVLCNTTLSDIEVCYKMFRSEVLKDLQITCKDFGFEVEFTVKVCCSPRRWRIYETGVSYYGRTYAEGKKVNWKDGLKALWYIFMFRFTKTRKD